MKLGYAAQPEPFRKPRCSERKRSIRGVLAVGTFSSTNSPVDRQVAAFPSEEERTVPLSSAQYARSTDSESTGSAMAW